WLYLHRPRRGGTAADTGRRRTRLRRTLSPAPNGVRDCASTAGQPGGWRRRGFQRTMTPDASANGPLTMTRPLRSLLFCTLFGLGRSSVRALAQNVGPLVSRTEEQSTLNRVDDDNRPRALDGCRGMAGAEDMQAQFEMREFYCQGARRERDR